MAAILEASPILRKMIVNIKTYSIELRTSHGPVEIQVLPANFRSIRGRAICAALIDESAFLRQDESAQPDIEILHAIQPALGRFGRQAVLLIASTVYRKVGILYDGWLSYFGKDTPEALCWLAPTLTMNPSFDASIIEEEIAKDPEKAQAEYHCVWR